MNYKGYEKKLCSFFNNLNASFILLMYFEIVKYIFIIQLCSIHELSFNETFCIRNQNQ